MIEFVEDNHLVFGWGDGRYNFSDQERPLHFRLGRSRSAPKNFMQECLLTARAIADRTSKPIWVALSGGIDSEVIARCFQQIKREFSVITVRFDGDKNLHDIRYAADFCRRNAIPQKIVDVDVGAFMQECRASPYVSNNVYRFMQMFIIEQVDRLGGYCVMGSGEQRYSIVDSRAIVEFKTEFTSTVHWMADHGVSAAPYFFLHRPELVHAFAMEPEAQKLFRLEIRPSKWSHNVKAMIYKKYWPDLVDRKKYSGYEQVIDARIETQKFLSLRWKKYLQKVRMDSATVIGDTLWRGAADDVRSETSAAFGQATLQPAP